MTSKDEKLIAKYSYFYGMDEEFIKEYLDQFKESDKILSIIVKNLECVKDDYEVNYNDECAFMIINKKTGNSYKISIEF